MLTHELASILFSAAQGHKGQEEPLEVFCCHHDAGSRSEPAAGIWSQAFGPNRISSATADDKGAAGLTAEAL
jgi:hypothetical protein